MRTARNGSNGHVFLEGSTVPEMLSRELFAKYLVLERKRAERSGRRFVMMLVDVSNLFRGAVNGHLLDGIVSGLSASIRETDIRGWYGDSIIAVIFTEIGNADGKAVVTALLNKTTAVLSGVLTIEKANEIKITFHVYPEDWKDSGPDDASGSRLYPDLVGESADRRRSYALKRSMDVIASFTALVLAAPVLLIIAAAVKLTSKGPVLFQQQRLGQYGRTFTFLKFRSMYASTDHAIHEQYVGNYIAGTLVAAGPDDQKPVYKMTDDPRITRIGRFLRRTSLDEVPQFFNVLLGDMSLVGPRPPLPYEFKRYGAWHRRRLLAVKPGITGLWQVAGRSRVPFDEMVRMDLRYAKTWSNWLDIKILFRTPFALLNSDGAY